MFEYFWALYNHIQLAVITHILRIALSEDEKNKQGGQWLFTLKKQQR
jgi:hypothetical protein